MNSAETGSSQPAPSARTRFFLPAPTVAIARDAMAMGLAVGLFGVAFGVLAVTNGATAAQAQAMSILVFTGASQFMVVSVIGSGGSPIAAIASALLLAARNAFYGLSVARMLPPQTSLPRRLAAAQLTIDESTALGLAQPDPQHRAGAFWSGGLSVFLWWNLGTLAGALGGDRIGDPAALGLDAAFPAGFVALIMPTLRHRSGRIAGVVGGLITLVLIPLLRPGIPILLAAFGAVIAMWVAGPIPEPNSTDAGVGSSAQ